MPFKKGSLTSLVLSACLGLTSCASSRLPQETFRTEEINLESIEEIANNLRNSSYDLSSTDAKSNPTPIDYTERQDKLPNFLEPLISPRGFVGTYQITTQGNRPYLDKIVDDIKEDRKYQTGLDNEDLSKGEAKEAAIRVIARDLISRDVGTVVEVGYDLRRKIKDLARGEYAGFRIKADVDGGLSGVDRVGLTLNRSLGDGWKFFFEAGRSIGADLNEGRDNPVYFLNNQTKGNILDVSTDFTQRRIDVNPLDITNGNYAWIGIEKKF